MTELNIDRFSDFFEAVTGHQPFTWQTRLAKEVAENGWPETLDLPTSSGKTSCIEVAVFTLALQADAGAERRAPRRIFFVVDRRVVVDQAYEHAARLASSLADRHPPPVVRTVAKRLRALAGPNAAPLGHERLRGGIPRENVWTRSPAQPAIIACTVDQVGSRLLFRSYDSSPLSAPMEAGLVANDALLLLDEAHCAVPFLQTTRAVAEYRSWAPEAIPSPWAVVSLSATPHADAEPPHADRVFSLSPEERGDPPLRQRLAASKPAALVVAREAKVPRRGGRTEVTEARRALAREIVGAALKLLKCRATNRMAVMVNRVATAVEVRRLLEEEFERGDLAGAEVVLMTGRMRPLDRDDLVRGWSPRLRAGGTSRTEETPVIVVSTQSLEVGADFDFDTLITEAASLDALRQRFGRLNRLGERPDAYGVIIIGAYQEKDSSEDPVYGPALARTWQWLRDQGVRAKGDPAGVWPLPAKSIERVVDFGIETMDELVAEAPMHELRALSKRAPVLMPAHLDRWVQTDPAPVPDPEPAFFLHGPMPARAEVQVLWRVDLESVPDGSLADALSLCPPSTVEALPVSLGWVSSWLRTAADEIPPEESDLEGRGESLGAEAYEARERLRIVVWRGRGETFRTADPAALRPGDFVIIPQSDPGPFEGLLRWQSSCKPVLDLGDRAQWVARRRTTLRLHPAHVRTWPDDIVPPGLKRELMEALARPPEEFPEVDLRAVLGRIRSQMNEEAAVERGYTWLLDATSGLTARSFSVAAHPAGDESEPAGIVLRMERTPTISALARAALEETLDEDASDRRSESDASVLLARHLEDVAQLANEFAELCGLPGPVREAITLAAALHDIGKSDPRFQALLHGDGLAAPREDQQLLAKSARFPSGPGAYRRLASTAGLPAGFRHELLSVRMAESVELPLAPELTDLALHLILSHHGHGRPFPPVVADDDPVTVSYEADGTAYRASSATGLERLGSDAAHRFWRLTRRYGWWGLAYLEAVLRTADRHASALEAAGRCPSDPAEASDGRRLLA